MARYQAGASVSTLASTASICIHNNTSMAHHKSSQPILLTNTSTMNFSLPLRSFSTKDDVVPATVVPAGGTLDTSTSLLDAFRDPLTRAERSENEVGKSWHARALRRKSLDDLHKLWFVLYRERNMLLTEAHLARRHQMEWVQPARLRKVRKSMGAIRQVLGERKRAKIAAFQERRRQQPKLAMEEEEEDVMMEDGEDVEYDGEDEKKQKS